MMPVQIKPDIHWVGGIDWNLRNFHGYLTQRGSTYNSYLIMDEKITLVDTVKHYLFDEMVSRIKHLVDPGNIDYIICNHVEMDHSGSIPMLRKLAPNAKIIASQQGKMGLRQHFGIEDVDVVKAGDKLKIGKRHLQFLPVPMVHWPDSMMTYIPDEKLLLSNDAFGQHIATTERFTDELGTAIIFEEAAKYYANIVMPYGSQVKKALEAASGLKIDMIAPSHGLIWREKLDQLLSEYSKWANYITEEKAVVVYDTMWHSTEKMAYSLVEGLEKEGISTTLRSLQASHISDIITDVLRCRGVFIGSPTLNCTYLPTVGAFLTYLKGLKPADRIGFAFGSYGWGGQAVKEINQFMEDAKWNIPFNPVNIKYIPSQDQLDQIRQIGGNLGTKIKEKSHDTKI